MRAVRPVALFGAAAAAYTGNVALGLAVTARLVDTGGMRWVHHALYVATSVSAGAACSSLLWSPSRAGWRLLPAAAPLAVIPYVGARTRRHPLIALSAAPFFAAALARALKEHRGVS